MKEQDSDKEKIIETLKSTPVIGVACAKAGLARSTYYRWIDEDQRFREKAKKALSYGNKNINDLAYGKLIKKINQESMPAITFYLRHRHPYFKRQEKMKMELVHKNGQIPTIPEDAYKKVVIGKLKKNLRRRVTKEGMKLADAMQEMCNEMDKEFPGFGKFDINSIDWGEVLKSVLEKGN